MNLIVNCKNDNNFGFRRGNQGWLLKFRWNGLGWVRHCWSWKEWWRRSILKWWINLLGALQKDFY